MKTEKNFYANIAALALKVHQEMMLRGMSGIYTPIEVCGIKVTCADDIQSVRNRFSQEMRRVPFADIDAAMAEYGLPV